MFSLQECSDLAYTYLLLPFSMLVFSWLRPFLDQNKLIWLRADKCRWREEEFLPWRQATPVAR